MKNFLLVILFGFLFVSTINAQSDCFFRGYNDTDITREGDSDGINGGITNNNFGAPIGNGLLIMVGVGAAYAVIRRKRVSKNSTTALLLAVTILLGMTQCKKKLDTINSVSGNTYNISLTVDNDSKVVVTPYGNYATVRFEDGDVIHVAYNTYYAGSLTYDGEKFTGSITATRNGDQKLYFYFLGNKPFRSTVTTSSQSFSVDISDQTGGLPVISSAGSNEVFTGNGSYTAALNNRCALVKFNTKNSQGTPINVNGLVRITGLKTVVGFDLKNASNSNNGFSSWGENGNIDLYKYNDNDTERWAILIPQAAMNVSAKAFGYLRKTGITVPKTTASDYLNSGVDVVLTPAPDGAFTSSADDTYIYFAKGNLQCKRKGDNWGQYEWSFKLNQYDIDYSEDYTVGDDYANENVVSHFGWGASGFNINANGTVDPLALNYKPNSTIGTYIHAAETDSVNPYRYGPSWTANPFDNHDAGVNIANTNFDWGVYNSAGGESGLGIKEGDTYSTFSWRLFTTNEIVYILGPNKASDAKPGNNCRLSSTINGVENARFVKARLSDASNGSGSGLNGLIIFPDVYTHPAAVPNPVNINDLDSYFASNVYTTAQWDLMDAEGAVFLPAAGCHERKNNRSYIHDINKQCYYWTSTCQNYDPTVNPKTGKIDNPAASAKNLRVAGAAADSHNMVTNSRTQRCRGSSVRLVRDAITTPPTPTLGE